MIYTARFAHLEKLPPYKVGRVILRGDKVGRMGNTGQSSAAHLHFDCVEGLQTGRYSLAMMEAGNPKPSARQANWFIDSELFGVEPFITTYYSDPAYQRLYGKDHPGYDIVPINRHDTVRNFDIHWNRSVPGRVVAIYDDLGGYGICVYIAFEI